MAVSLRDRLRGVADRRVRRPTLRGPAGEQELEPGDVAVFRKARPAAIRWGSTGRMTSAESSSSPPNHRSPSCTTRTAGRSGSGRRRRAIRRCSRRSPSSTTGTAKPRAVAVPTGVIHVYGGESFNYRFDAEVDPRGTITIVCRVKFEIDKDMFRAEGYSDAEMERERREFAAGFPAVINAAWSYKRALKADWRPQMNCVARAVPVESGEHARITLAYPKTGFRSYVDARTQGRVGPTTGASRSTTSSPRSRSGCSTRRSSSSSNTLSRRTSSGT